MNARETKRRVTNSAQDIIENFPEKVAFGLSLEDAEICEFSKLGRWVSRQKEEYCKGMRKHGVFGK